MMKFFWPLQSTNWKETIQAVVSMKPLKPFHPEVLSFLHSVSKAILKDHAYRRYPELIALAYWLRKAHIAEMRNSFEKETEEKVVLARGNALHFAPSNVDTIFVYSWVLSMLSGNSNILRISGRKQEQTELLLKVILQELKSFPEVGGRTAIVTYDHDVEITKYLSTHCHVRVIWGGDETVKAIRSVPLVPLATELAFPDRFSLSVFDAQAVVDATDAEFADFLHRFYNDGFWFAQMACSSPRMIVWIGEKDKISEAQERFWYGLDRHLTENLPEISPALQVQKLATGYLLSTKNNTISFQHAQNFSRLKVDGIDLEVRERHCGGGLFVELELSHLMNLIPILNDKDQTLSYFGFSKDQLIDFAHGLQNRSLDRIVPIGQALDFEGIWDGYDLLRHFTREIVIR